MYKSFPKFFLGLALATASLAATVTLSGCHKGVEPAAIPDNSGPDPSDANMAPVSGTQPAPAPQPARVLGIRSQSTPEQSSEQYPQQPAPTQNEAITAAQTAQPSDQNYDQNYDYNAPTNYDESQIDAGQQALEEANQPPPPLPEYQQPEAPAPNYLWTPGYWGYAPVGYYWVPGAWCAPPFYGALWTPGYWGFFGGRYLFHRGFWGPHIGFYGGVNYGFGYTGSGYHGGYWQGRNFYYNRSVNNINTTRITNVYNRTVVVNNTTINRVSYNGGRGGINVRPQPAEIAANRGPRVPPMSTQYQNQRAASENRQQFYNVNKGRPAVVAATRPIAAQPGIQRPAPVQNRPVQPENRPQVQPARPGQPQTRPVQPENRPQVQPTRPNQPQTRPVQPANRPQVQPARPGQPQTRPVQPENRPQVQPARPAQPQTRPAQPQPRPAQPQTRPVQPRPVQPQTRPAPAQSRPAQPQARPAPQQPRPQPTERPAPRPQPQQARPAPAPRPQAQPRPASKPEESKPR